MNIHLNQYRQQQGLSLVELMVALVLGMLLMTGIIQVFLSSKQTYAANETSARVQENGRFALEFMSRTARLAGYVEPVYEFANVLEAEKKTKPLPLVREACTGLAIPTELCTRDGGGNASDSISFIMQPPIIDGQRRDCLGNIITGKHDQIITNFSIIPATGPNPDVPAALGCRAYNLTTGLWTAGPNLQPLVEGIDRIQVLYGIDTPPLSARQDSVNQYVSAERVGATIDAWKNVRAVRISVLANSVIRSEATVAARQFVLLDAAPVTAVELVIAEPATPRSRQIFTTTIQFKNFKQE